jgi:hypothetical protein
MSSNGDGEWLAHSIANGTISICNDGSYMKERSKTACSGAFIIHCTETKREIKGCFVDQARDANNYRGELLGSLGPMLILKAAYESNPDPIETALASNPNLTINLHCDNKGVLTHGNSPFQSLKAEQSQADLIRLLKTYTRELPFKTTWNHVNGHADKYKAFDQLTHEEQLNVRCDEIAKAHLIQAIESTDYIHHTFPREDISIFINGQKVRSSITKAIYTDWGRTTAQRLFLKRQKVTPSAFNEISWGTVGAATSTFPPTFQDWITRHISDFNGCNRYLSRWTPNLKNKCHCCKQPNEDTSHVIRCPHPIRKQLYLEGAATLKAWMEQNHTPTDITLLYHKYISNRGERTMTSLLPHSSPLLPIAEAQDDIGFDNLLVGRLPNKLITHLNPPLAAHQRRGISGDIWAKKFATELILFTHRQWNHRNEIINYKPSEGKTVAEHELIDTQVSSLLSLDPDELLPHHRHLLLGENFTELGSSKSSTKQLWIAEIQAALTEASLWKRLRRKCSKHKYTKIKVKSDKKIIAVRNINSTLFSYKAAQTTVRKRNTTRN